ncbi:hypothetical protein Enr13x_65650 [Stieleria neptunia]|uniref:Glycosyltransferase RgtA/B/C/D-like domain-containing protein n=1 Tax=Stieleria neptunia TaxID=2527979 RepID=A0A518I0L8_9BACT|nr:hypothetical protein [Stieleria neptunia]QDV46656.1 hypothetical protein Enr13x_65650 [Stieleria neptunia]
MPLLRDLMPLFAIQLALLIATLALGPGNLADVRVQLTWTGFVALGWLIAPSWVGNHGALMRRYLAAMISAITLHGLLAFTASLCGFGMNTYLAIWTAGLLTAGIWRHDRLRGPAPVGPAPVGPALGGPVVGGPRWPVGHTLVIITLIVFSVCVYRTPRSNDIHQFLLQQQDMLRHASLRVSSIGMAAMEVDQPMPRWMAHYWHSLPAMIAHTSGIAVDQVLLRYATIPVAFSVLLCLVEALRSLAGRRASYPLVLLAMLGPVLLWYRNFNAFNYSFRITNNLLLDKDFALFFLIPATLWLARGWIHGKSRYWIPLLGLLPALVRFHPLTAIYLLLLTAPFSILVTPVDRPGIRRVATLAVATLLLCLGVVLIGDAQSNHEQIRQIIQIDYEASLDRRPIHYWVGFYNTIPGTPLPCDTTEWVGGRFHLKHSLITGCGLLAMMHLGVLVLGVLGWIGKGNGRTRRLFGSGLIAVGMLWGMWLVSGSFLTRFPHYAAGYERLHWFAYPIALAVVASAMASCIPRRVRRVVGMASLVFVVVSALAFRFETATPLKRLRGLNSLLDVEIAGVSRRRADWQAIPWTRSLADLRPHYLQPSDRALLLSQESTQHYWLIRQGVFWSDPYVEAFAWFHRGDDFRTDRRYFYDLLDRQSVSGLAEWIAKKDITLIIDLREGGDRFLDQLSKQHDLPMRRIEPGVWRIDPAPHAT